jgi:hypothetical protein
VSGVEAGATDIEPRNHPQHTDALAVLGTGVPRIGRGGAFRMSLFTIAPRSMVYHVPNDPDQSDLNAPSRPGSGASRREHLVAFVRAEGRPHPDYRHPRAEGPRESWLLGHTPPRSTPSGLRATRLVSSISNAAWPRARAAPSRCPSSSGERVSLTQSPPAARRIAPSPSPVPPAWVSRTHQRQTAGGAGCRAARPRCRSLSRSLVIGASFSGGSGLIAHRSLRAPVTPAR